MPAIRIRDVPDEVLEALKNRARRRGRSLQGELRHILSSVARSESIHEQLPPLKLHFSDASPQTSWSREEIYGDDGR